MPFTVEPDRGYTGAPYTPPAPVVIPRTIRRTKRPSIPAPEPDRGYVPTALPVGTAIGAGAGITLAGAAGLVGELFPQLAPVAGVVATVAGAQALLGGEDMANGGPVATVGSIVDGVPIGGPGVPEPPRALVARQWKIKVFSKAHGEYWQYFFKLIDGRVMCFNPYKGWTIWKPKKPLAVMYRGKTTLSQAVKVQSYLDKLWRKVAKRTKALKMA